MKNQPKKPKTTKTYTPLDTAQSSFLRPMKKKQFKLARTRRVKNK